MKIQMKIVMKVKDIQDINEDINQKFNPSKKNQALKIQAGDKVLIVSKETNQELKKESKSQSKSVFNPSKQNQHHRRRRAKLVRFSDFVRDRESELNLNHQNGEIPNQNVDGVQPEMKLRIKNN